MKIRGWVCLFLFRISLKNGLEEARMTLWASTCWPSSQARVTSVKSLSPLKSPKEEITLFLKSFHCRQSFSELSIFCVKTSNWVLSLPVVNAVSSPPLSGAKPNGVHRLQLRESLISIYISITQSDQTLLDQIAFSSTTQDLKFIIIVIKARSLRSLKSSFPPKEELKFPARSH